MSCKHLRGKLEVQLRAWLLSGLLSGLNLGIASVWGDFAMCANLLSAGLFLGNLFSHQSPLVIRLIIIFTAIIIIRPESIMY